MILTKDLKPGTKVYSVDIGKPRILIVEELDDDKFINQINIKFTNGWYVTAFINDSSTYHYPSGEIIFFNKLDVINYYKEHLDKITKSINSYISYTEQL